MNYKSNKIFTKCCASILAVSNIFSGVSATPEEKPKKAEDNQLSISTNEFLVSILLASGFATLATLPLSKKIFSAKSTPAKFNGSKIGGYGFFNPADTTEDIEEVELDSILPEFKEGGSLTKKPRTIEELIEYAK